MPFHNIYGLAVYHNLSRILINGTVSSVYCVTALTLLTVICQRRGFVTGVFDQDSYIHKANNLDFSTRTGEISLIKY